MTDQWPADDIATEFRDASGEFAENFHPDTFQVERVIRVPDGSGGWTEEPSVVGSGRCRLDVTTRGVERSAGVVIVAASSYTVEMLLGVDLLPTDTLIVNGRSFEVVGGPFRGGDMEMFTTANLEERS